MGSQSATKTQCTPRGVDSFRKEHGKADTARSGGQVCLPSTARASAQVSGKQEACRQSALTVKRGALSNHGARETIHNRKSLSSRSTKRVSSKKDYKQENSHSLELQKKYQASGNKGSQRTLSASEKSDMAKKHAFGDSQSRILTNEKVKATKADAKSLHDKISVNRSR